MGFYGLFYVNLSDTGLLEGLPREDKEETCLMNMRFYGLFYVKNEVSAETSLIFYFYCGSVSRETDEKMSIFFQNFLASKVKLADGFMNETG